MFQVNIAPTGKYWL